MDVDAIAKRDEVFQIGRKTSPETEGIWLCVEPYNVQEGILDSEIQHGTSS